MKNKYFNKEENSENDFVHRNYSKYDIKADCDFKWQKKCLDVIKKENKVILSSPTGSGKTRVFLEWANEKKEGPIIITAPIKALTNQRYKDLLKKGFKVGLETGDIKNIPEGYDYLCCTQEIYTNKYTQMEDATVILDEFHYIYDNPERARSYIDGLYNSKAKNILICSATLGNIDDFKNYIDMVTKSDFKVFENHSRITDMHFGGDIGSSDIKNALVIAFSKDGIERAANLLREVRDENSFKRIGKINKIKELAEEYGISNDKILKDLFLGIAKYHGAMLPKQKLFVEKCLEDGLIDIVIGTDALALGVNFPFENVVFGQLAKYYEGPISKNLFDQIASRAGRKGYYDRGNVYYWSKLAREIEALGYTTSRLYEKNLKRKNENIFIELNPRIKEILNKKVNIEDEVEYISKFSTIEIDKDELKANIEETIDSIYGGFEKNVLNIMKDEIYDEIGIRTDLKKLDFPTERHHRKYEELMEKNDEYHENISKVYFEEYSPEENIKLFTKILYGVDRDRIIKEVCYSKGYADYLLMKQFYKYIKNLPSEYRIGFGKLKTILYEIDDTDEFQFPESKVMDEIAEDLKESRKLSSENISRVLSMQKKDINSMKDLKLIDKSGMEDYDG